MKDWYYDEYAQVGVDYADRKEAEVYDERMERFRDYEKEAQDFIARLGLENPEQTTAIDLGCGTGAFAIHAAKHLKSVLAVDVSDEMIAIARSKAERLGIENITFHKFGFLDFTPPEPVEVINSKWALHHLPDYWKQAALLRMNRMLTPGGTLLLTDWVFPYDVDYDGNMEELLAWMRETMEENFVREATGHIREEFSTFDWVLEGMIRRAGFDIERTGTAHRLASEYLCRKIMTLPESPS